MITTILLTACAPDLRDSDTFEDTDAEVTDTSDGEDTENREETDVEVATRVVSIPEGATGVTYVEVDGTTPDAWVYFDFASSVEVRTTDGWELAVQRNNVMTNGGTSGSGGVEVTRVEDAALESVSAAPDDGWGGDEGETYALGDWFDYDPTTHVLTAHPRVYVIRNAAGETWKLKFVDYYDDAGNSGHPSFRWAAL